MRGPPGFYFFKYSKRELYLQGREGGWHRTRAPRRRRRTRGDRGRDAGGRSANRRDLAGSCEWWRWRRGHPSRKRWSRWFAPQGICSLNVLPISVERHALKRSAPAPLRCQKSGKQTKEHWSCVAVTQRCYWFMVQNHYPLPALSSVGSCIFSPAATFVLPTPVGTSKRYTGGEWSTVLYPPSCDTIEKYFHFINIYELISVFVFIGAGQTITPIHPVFVALNRWYQRHHR